MIKVIVTKEVVCPVSVVKIKKELAKLLEQEGITSDAVVEVAIIGEVKMNSLGRKYLKDGKLHNVLSFPWSEAKVPFATPPDGVIRLGEIVVCASVAKREAMSEDVLLEAKVIELVTHGGLHLLGKHHD